MTENCAAKCIFFKRQQDPRDFRYEIRSCLVAGSDLGCGGFVSLCPSLKDAIVDTGQSEEETLALLLQTPTFRRKLKAHSLS